MNQSWVVPCPREEVTVYRLDRASDALKHLDNMKEISYYKGIPQRLVSINRLKHSEQWPQFNPQRSGDRAISQSKESDNEDVIGTGMSSQDSEVEEKRSEKKPRVRVPCRQLSNYEWCNEWLFKLCNHPSNTLPLI